MSLMLRKAGQEILDNHGLSTHHVGISNNSHHLVIQTECGKPFVTLWGVQFNRAKPTEKEIDYACELLDAFLGTHMPTILKFLKAQAAFTKMKVPVIDKDFQVNFHNTHFYRATNSQHPIGQLFYNDNMFNLQITIKTDKTHKPLSPTTKINLRDVKASTMTNIDKFKFNKPLYKKASKQLLEHMKYEEAKAKLDEMKEELSACNI